VDGRVDAVSEQTLGRDEAVAFLKTVLSDHGLSVLQDGRTVTILRTADAITETSVKIGADPAAIPRDAEVVTQIIPVRSLNPVELGRVLPSLLPAGARITVNESANALLLTDTHANVRRAAEIIAALDSVSASANTLNVYPLRFADAKTLADLVKQLFSPPDTGRAGASGTGAFISLPGGRGFGGGPGAFNGFARGDADTGRTPLARVAAVADEHGNAVIVSAPEALFPAIEHLIAAVDVPVDDITDIQVFTLKNADCTELASMLASLFPDDNNASDASGATFRFNGQGGRGGQAIGTRQGTADNPGGASSRMQRLGRVLAVPDPRTSSLVVTAAKSVMPEIEKVIARLDGDDSGRVTLHNIPVLYGDLWQIQQMIQGLYPSGTTASANSTVTDPFELRRVTLMNSIYSSASSTGATSGNAFGPSVTSGSRGSAP
jgi:type II secretory pathway component GspD/PulD (secretin)